MKNFYPLSRLKSSLLRLCMSGIALMWIAGAAAQPITLSMRDATIRQVIEKLQKEYGYSFSILSSEVDVNRKVSVSVRQADIRTVLDTIFAADRVTCTIDGKLISVARAVEPETKSPATPATIRGVILDEEGHPVVGAAVIVKGTPRGSRRASTEPSSCGPRSPDPCCRSRSWA